MSVDRERVAAIFERAQALPRVARAGFLDGACGSDTALRRELDSLLDAHDAAPAYFDGLSRRVVSPALGELGVITAPLNVLAMLAERLADTYRIERELGGGGMSRVFVAEDITLGRRVVIKMLPPEMAVAVSVDRFRREIAVAAQLQHSHIVPLLTANASHELLYYTMPYVDGQSLRDRLADGPLAVDHALTIWRDILDALSYAHAAGVVHRDIKPGNVLLSGRNALVTDFGIARAIEVAATHTRATMTGPIGTPAYMAPEQVIGGPVDERTDLYAAGLVLYEMLGGRVPADLVDLLARCMATNAAMRPPSAESILAELDALSRRAPGGRRRRRLLLAASAAIALAVTTWGVTRVRFPSSTPARARHTPPDTVTRLYQRGLAEQRRRTLEGSVDAMSLFERAIAIDSGFSLAWAATARTAQFADNRGWVLPGRNADSLLSLAVRASRRAVALDSGSAEAWTVAGKVAGAVDLESRAATLYALRKALALDSTYAEAWFELGLAYEESLQPADAERAWLRAAQLSPTNVQVLAFLGFHFLWYDDYTAGARWADSALAVEPTYALARDAAGYLALAMRRPESAKRHADVLLRSRGNEPHLPLCLLAVAAAQEGDVQRSRDFARRAEELVAGHRPSKHESTYIAGAWAAAGDTARALRWLAAYEHQNDLHFQLHVRRDPELRWVAARR
ncbi:MAG TPA: protein kinase [Gemmatimonadaceae bacterium]|nr:protein kinase [Gemmatimonadaceae bacterium]